MGGELYPLGLLGLIVVMALLYSAVGHGGASGYLAAMALFGLAPELMKPAALTMNVFVAALVLYRLARARYFDWRLFAPLAVASVPLAFVGGAFQPADTTYKYVVGAALLVAAVQLLWQVGRDAAPLVRPGTWITAPLGAGLGFLSGMTGVGGGVFLSPVLLFLGWTTMRTNAAIAAAFILVNSLAGLAGLAASGRGSPEGLPWLVLAAVAGALPGSELALRRFTPQALRRVLGLVLLIAAVKMVLTA